MLTVTSADKLFTMASHFRKIYFPLLLALVAWLLLFFVLGEKPFLTNDTIGQFNLLDKGIYLNWKPALYQAFLALCRMLIGCEHAAYLAFIFQIFFAFVGIVLISLSLYRKSSPIFLWLPLVAGFFFVKGCGMHVIGNDTMFASSFLLATGMFLFALQIEQRFLRWGLAILAFPVMIFALAMRHNGFPLILCALFYFCYIINKKILRSAILSVVVLVAMVGAIELSNSSLNVRKSYPLNVSFADDLMNLSIMHGKWSSFLLEEPDAWYAKHDLSKSGWAVRADIGNGYPYIFTLERQTDRVFHDRIKDAWIEEVKDHPIDYINLKLLLFHQTLFGGRSLPFIDNLFTCKYPNTGVALHDVYDWRCYISYQFCMVAVIPWLTWLGIPTAFWLARRRGRWNLSRQLLLPLMLALGVLGYVFTFLPYTLAPTEWRYYTPQAALSIVALLIAAGYLITFYRKGAEGCSPMECAD